MSASGVWNSLEVVKLVVASCTPLVAAFVGYLISRRLKRIEELQWVNQTVVQWKMKTYGEVVPLLNDVFCYCCYVGNWKESRPPDVIGMKRTLDKSMRVACPLLSVHVWEAYEEFVGLCFDTFVKKGHDAQIRTGFQSRKDAAGAEWDERWEVLFVDDPAKKSPKERIYQAYDAVVRALAKELSLGLRADGNVLPVLEVQGTEKGTEPNDAVELKESEVKA